MRLRVSLFMIAALSLLTFQHRAAFGLGVIEERTVRVLSAMLVQLPKYIHFPSKPENRITACLYANDPLEPAMRVLAQQKTDLAVLTISTLAEADVCNMLYISERFKAKQSIRQLRGKPVLLVSNYPQFIEEGGDIGLVDRNGQIGIYLNMGALADHTLQPRPDLVEIATRVIQ